MPNEIDDALIQQFSGEVHVAAQQMKARLRSFVRVKPMFAETFAYDGLGLVEAQEVFGRHQPVQFADINHTRRKIARRRFFLALPIDMADARSILSSVGNDYAAACVRAMERVFDKVVIQAMFADVLTGRDFGTTVTFASEGTTVDATAGVTYEKLLELDKNFIDEEVGTDVPERLVIGLSGDEHEALMKEIELISGDFTRQFAVEGGRLKTLLGYDLVLFGASIDNPLLQVASAKRSNFGMTDRAMCVGMSKEMELKIQERNDLIETDQVTILFDLGAVRTEGVLIQKFESTE